MDWTLVLSSVVVAVGLAVGIALAFRRRSQPRPQEIQSTMPPWTAGAEMKVGAQKESTARAIFISYASQDIARVQPLRDALVAAGLDVWFDKGRLQGGEDFDHSIKRRIRDCSVFVPVISRITQHRPEGYFRLEWNLAAERAKLIADTIPFILPVALDPVREDGALVPERFRQVHWTLIASGAPTQEFVARLSEIIKDRDRDKTLERTRMA